MKLREISPSDSVASLAIDGLESTCPMLLDAEFFGEDGNSYINSREREGNTPASIFRSLNESKTGTPPTHDDQVVTKRIVSIEAKVDKQFERRGGNVESEIAKQLYLEAREAGWVLQDKFFHGDEGTDAEEFDGFDNLVDAAWDLDLAAEHGETNGMQVPLGNSDAAVTAQQKFIEYIFDLTDRVQGGATHLYVPYRLKQRLVTVAMNLRFYSAAMDEMNRVVERIGDVILRSAGRKKDGTSVIPFNETVGASNDCASFYAVRWGERFDLSMLTTNGMVADDNGIVGKFYEYDANMDARMILQNKTALVKLAGFRI